MDDARRGAIYREGQEANDKNRRVMRDRRGILASNPYEAGSEEWRVWREAYQYRDMINDG